MWIRSQDKKIFIHALAIVCSTIFAKENEVGKRHVYRVEAWVDGEVYFVVGTYESEERCLEIIDEIQEYLGIYNMPEK